MAVREDGRTHYHSTCVLPLGWDWQPKMVANLAIDRIVNGSANPILAHIPAARPRSAIWESEL